MSYAEEYSPGSDIATFNWTRAVYGMFEYSDADKALSTLLENCTHQEEQVEEAVHRLAQISAVTGDVRARVSLAVFGGLDVRDGEFFKRIVDNPVESCFEFQAEMRVLKMARDRRDLGDELSYTALSATVGIYPPEYGDSIIDPATRLDPFYDSKNTFIADTESVLQELATYGSNSG